MFRTYAKEGFPEREERILGFWAREQVFEQSLEQTRGGPRFSFYDGPPFATGLPHYGHLLAGTVKDVIPRYWTMQGYFVPRRFGWDCHGLPIENEIEKAKELTGAAAIEQFGIAAFNEECRSIVLRYTAEWERTVARMGRWVDFKSAYRTMDKGFMESVWWVFGQLYEQGLVYEGFKVMPFSARLGTPLSNFEANLNYREVADPSLTVAFVLRDEPDVALLAWTTTPWTLPSNLALAVHPDLDYVKVRDRETLRTFILAEARLTATLKDYEVLGVFKGKELGGREYLPLFPYFTEMRKQGAFRVLVDPFVSIEDGTGVVHMAPAFGEIDFFVCSRAGIAPVCPIDQNGRFTDEVGDYRGQFVKDADKEIIRRLKGEGKVIHHGQVVHRYPFCWRSDTPLIYKVVKTWFVAVEKIKDKLLAANAEIRWVPGHIKEGRFGKWLENARDWAISRNRYWGTPIPIWRSEDGEVCVITSVKELQDKVGKQVTDLHRHFIDDLTFTKGGKVFRRIPEVFDCWFESGSMPYAEPHYPFEHREEFEKNFPADFIGEGIDQTRGWFYTLTVLAAALFDRPAFKNVIVNGIILAEDGTKMSKRLKNYPEPGVVIDRYGADAIRLYLISSPGVMAEDIRFSAKGVELTLRQVLIPLWNAYHFFATYATIYSWKPRKGVQPKSEIDRWILSLLQKLVQQVQEGMERYALKEAVEPFIGFIDQLTNWYIRRSRGRFWADEASPDRDEAFATLSVVLKTVAQVAAPFVPFLSEAIYLELKEKDDPLSVHLCKFPTYQAERREVQLEEEMALVQRVVSLGHALRKEQKIRVRQPLACAFLISSDEQAIRHLMRHEGLILEELNVKQLKIVRDETAFVTLVAKPNFRVLGKKVGSLMGAVQKRVATLSKEEMGRFVRERELTLNVDGQEVVLSGDDLSIEKKVREGVSALTEGEITIALDLILDEPLVLEGMARELVNRINTMRKEAGFEVVDRIRLTVDTTSRVREAFSIHDAYIRHEVLAIEVAFSVCQGEEWDVIGERTILSIEKATSP